MTMGRQITIPLSPIATVEGVSRLVRLMREHRDTNAVLNFDASRIRDLDCERLQLLICAVRGGGDIRISGLHESVRATLEKLSVLSHLGAVIEAAPPAAGLQTEPDTMAKRILTIDDSKTMRDMLMLTLADAGFDVLQAVDGEDGLSVLSRERVDLVITDINMPKMDGYEVIRRMRAEPAYQKLPVLVLTTEAEADKRAIAKEAGATGWMVKPFDPERLVQTVLKVAA